MGTVIILGNVATANLHSGIDCHRLRQIGRQDLVDDFAKLNFGKLPQDWKNVNFPESSCAFLTGICISSKSSYVFIRPGESSQVNFPEMKFLDFPLHKFKINICIHCSRLSDEFPMSRWHFTGFPTFSSPILCRETGICLWKCGACVSEFSNFSRIFTPLARPTLKLSTSAYICP